MQCIAMLVMEFNKHMSHNVFIMHLMLSVCLLSSLSYGSGHAQYESFEDGLSGNWKILNQYARVVETAGERALSIHADSRTNTAGVQLLLNESMAVPEGIVVTFSLYADRDVGNGRFSIQVIDSTMDSNYEVMMAASPKYFGDATGFYDRSELGIEGARIQPGTKHYMKLILLPDSAKLLLDGRLVLEQSNMSGTSLVRIDALRFTVLGSAPWRIGFIQVSAGKEAEVSANDREIIQALAAENSSRLSEDRLREIDAEVKRLSRVPSGTRPPKDPDNLSYIDAVLLQCEEKGYEREKGYWKLREQLSEQMISDLLLEKSILKGSQSIGELSSEDEERWATIQNQQEAKDADDARAVIEQVDEVLSEVSLEFSWHRVKTQLLADLINRARRVYFYYNEGALVASSDIDWELVDGAQSEFFQLIEQQLEQNRDWEMEYGECFFGVRELELTQEDNRDYDDLLERAMGLQEDLEYMRVERESLELRVLEFLNLAIPGVDYNGLGIPYRKESLTIDEDGHPSELIFSTMEFGYPQTDVAAHEPLCADVLDLKFFGLKMDSRQSVVDVSPGILSRARDLAEADYYFKQPVTINSYFRKSTYRDIRLLPEDERSDPSLFLHDENGNALEMCNIWSPKILALLEDTLTAAAEYCRENIPNFLLYEKLAWEGSGLGKWTDVYGYNDEALQAFRTLLREEYGTISALNATWMSDYSSFDEIEFPPSPFSQKDARPTALSYSFQKFRTTSWMGFMGHCESALKKADPERHVGTELNTLNASFVNGTVPSNRLWRKSPAIFAEDHYNNWLPNYASMNMLYSLCYYAGKQPIETEMIWTYPRLIQPETEVDFRVTGELAVWRRMVWGRKMLQIFAPQNAWGYQHGYFNEKDSLIHQPEKYFGHGAHGAFIREAATSLVVAKKRAREFWPQLKFTEVVKPETALIVPITSMYNEYPYEALSVTYPVYTRAFIRWEELLGSRDIDFRYVPEDALLDGVESLDSYSVVILPYATYLPEEFSKELLAWVEKGGTLIAEGVPGAMNAYAIPDPILMNAVFGDEVRWQYTGTKGRGTQWSWVLDVPHRLKRIVEVEDADGDPDLISTAYGKGQVYVCATPLNTINQQDNDDINEIGFAYAASDGASIGTGTKTLARDVIYRAILEKIGLPTVSNAEGDFELVLREGEGAQRYLFVVNPDLRETRTAEIVLKGQYQRAYDLGLGHEFEVPIHAGSGARPTSIIHLQLAPGEGTCIKLIDENL